MPRLGNGTELLKLLLTQVSKDMRQPLVPMIFPVLGAHMSGAEFQYPYLTFKEPCGMMANLVAESGGNKGQLEALHVSMDKPKDAKHQLRVWVNRGFITRSNQTGLFTKTQEYLNRGK